MPLAVTVAAACGLKGVPSRGAVAAGCAGSLSGLPLPLGPGDSRGYHMLFGILNSAFGLSTDFFSLMLGGPNPQGNRDIVALPLSLGQKLRELREAKKGLSLQDIADAVERSKSTVSSWETGKTEPVFSELKVLAKVLQVRAGYFFDEIPELADKEPVAVAVFESLRLFLPAQGLGDAPDHPYWRAIDLPTESPKTVEAWGAYDKITAHIFPGSAKP